jgi:hypothetical protein
MKAKVRKKMGAQNGCPKNLKNEKKFNEIQKMNFLKYR